jgi:hypothetical protein
MQEHRIHQPPAIMEAWDMPGMGFRKLDKQYKQLMDASLNDALVLGLGCLQIFQK